MNVYEFRERLDEIAGDVPLLVCVRDEWVEVDDVVVGLQGAGPVALITVPAPDSTSPSPGQWAAWFRHCADEADEMTEDHRKLVRLMAEHFGHDWIVRKAAAITGVDS